MSRSDVLCAGMILMEGQFICSSDHAFFAGIIGGQFGVFAGTPAAPIGTSVILADSARITLAASGSLASFHRIADTVPNWQTVASIVPTYCVMQSDGDLCDYTGTPDRPGARLFSSSQHGGHGERLLPYPGSVKAGAGACMDVHVANAWASPGKVMARWDGGGQSPLFAVDGDVGNPETPRVTVRFQGAPYGTSCWMVMRDAYGHDHESVDSFRFGDPHVGYEIHANMLGECCWTRES